jgi:uncharacterized membrane protein
MYMKQICLYAGAMLGAYFVLPAQYALAAVFRNQTQFDNLVDILGAVVDVLVLLGFPVIILLIIYDAFLLIAAQGNKDNLSKAKDAVLWTIIGAVLLLAARPIIMALLSALEPILVPA